VSKEDIEFEAALVQLPGVLASKVRLSVEHVLACVAVLKPFREAALALHRKISQRKASVTNDIRVTELRDGIDEIDSILIAFDEFVPNTEVRSSQQTLL
jgi:hypothetical protein